MSLEDMDRGSLMKVGFGSCPWISVPVTPMLERKLTDGAFRLYCLMHLAVTGEPGLTLDKICLLRNAEVDWVKAELAELEKHGFICCHTKHGIEGFMLWSMGEVVHLD